MTELVQWLSTSPLAFTIVILIVGLLFGSFLNVVILRLPVMMEREWRSQCTEFLNPDAPPPAESTQDKPFNLVFPASHCPKCDHAIAPWDNVPVFSFLILGGKCRHCKTKIAARYPIIEAATGAASAWAAWHFGFGWETAAALVFTWTLIAMSVIDFDHQLLPDSMTLPLAWIGLLLSVTGLFTNPVDSIIGAAAGYMSLWSLYHLFKLLTGKEGMGFGDFKLFAAFGAWFGWQCLPAIILLSSLVGAIIGIGLILIRGRDRNIPIPFGPYLAAAAWIYLYWGAEINRWYLSTLTL